jgi:hypothetical protein
MQAYMHYIDLDKLNTIFIVYLFKFTYSCFEGRAFIYSRI